MIASIKDIKKIMKIYIKKPTEKVYSPYETYQEEIMTFPKHSI